MPLISLKPLKLSGLEVSEAELYRRAQELEKKSQEFYLQKAEEAKAAGADIVGEEDRARRGCRC